MKVKHRLNSTTPKNNLAIAYLRVSTEQQDEQGNSIDAQRQRAKEYATSKGLIINEFVKEAKSASKIHSFGMSNFENSLFEALKNRPNLLKILKLAQQRKFKHLIVYSRDRLIRNFEVFIKLTYFFSKYDITIHYTKPGENLLDGNNNHISRFLELVIGNIAELESNLISQRVKDGLKQKVLNGFWAGGRTPYGYVLNDSNNDRNKTIIPSYYEMEHIRKIFYYYNNFGYSFEKIAHEMNQLYETNIWKKSKVESIIKNEVYTGKIVWNRRSRKKNSTPTPVKSKKIKDSEIISENEWELSEKLRNKKSSLKDSKYFSTPFLLRDFAVCSICNKPLKAKNYGKDSKNVYRCPTKNGHKSHLLVEQNILENQFIEKFSQTLQHDYLDDLWKCYSKKVIEEKKINKRLLDEINDQINYKSELINKITNLLYKSNDLYMKTPLLTEKSRLLEEIKDLKEYKKQIEKYEETYFQSKDELNRAVKKFFDIDFKKLNNSSKRIVLDTLVYEVIVKKDLSNEDLSFEIIYKNSI